MKRTRRPLGHTSHDRWLVSYADFITLLFAFFVVLYSAAEVDKKKIGQVAASIQAAFAQMGAFPPSAVSTGTQSPTQGQVPTPVPVKPEAADNATQNQDLAALRQELEQALAEEIARGEVAIRTEPDGLVVSLREIGFFDSGSATIEARSKPAFTRMAALLAQRRFNLRIEGHTDNVPVHNSQFASNWELSTGRATELVRLLITEYGIPAPQLSAAGYGEYHPIATNDSVEGRAMNRRVDVVVLGKLHDQDR